MCQVDTKEGRLVSIEGASKSQIPAGTMPSGDSCNAAQGCYFISTILRTERKSSALRVYKYTPVAT